MTIKIRKGNKKEKIQYKSTKRILTSKDIKEADRFDDALNKEIADIEKILIKKNMLTSRARKSEMLNVWYLIGSRINKFLKNNKISPEEEGIFWEQLYGRSGLINKTVPSLSIGKTRNDFRIASILATYPIRKLKRIKFWALWREVLTYRAFQDGRVMNWVLNKIEKMNPKTRNEARPFLKSVSLRMKKIDTSVLNDKELVKKLNDTAYK